MNEREATVYKSAVDRTFRFLKAAARADELWTRAIRLPEDAGYLLPVCELHAEDDELIALLGRWREESAHVYPTQFPVTFEGTKRWLRARVLDDPNRILFLITDLGGKPIGHVGFASALNDEGLLELDNLLRGSFRGHRELVPIAVKALLDWAQDTIAPAGFYLRVLASLKHVIKLDQRLGFVEEGRIPLRKEVDGECVAYVEDYEVAEPDEWFMRMRYQPAQEWTGDRMILTAGPSIAAQESTYAFDATQNGWNGEWNKYLRKFERSFAEYVGRKHAIATSSCTGALHLSLLALGIGPGDEVVVPDITWVATANAVLYVGATPVFADVQPDSWCLDPESFRRAITPRTKAVMPVHLYGHPADMDRITEIARHFGIAVVEDAAPAIGAECRGRKAGTFGEFACFSFQGAKLLVTGEGGMLVTDDDALFERVQSLWDQGRDPHRTFWISDQGWKYKMSNVQAAIGLGQLERVDELIEMKRRVFRWYEEGLQDVPGIVLARESDFARSIYWMSSVLVTEEAGIEREALRAELKRRNVDTRPVFPAISQYPIWPRHQDPQPVAKRIGEGGINLPSGVRLRREQVTYVCDQIRAIVRESAMVTA
ncbi:MAG: bifunctional GNAT family N-acetyltransferase/PLP-dependent aspartate aminotransferase family protein [Fimbriimonas sp.]